MRNNLLAQGHSPFRQSALSMSLSRSPSGHSRDRRASPRVPKTVTFTKAAPKSRLYPQVIRERPSKNNTVKDQSQLG